MQRTTAFLSRSSLHAQVHLWNTHLPWIRPFYAVKCNNMSPLLEWIHVLGVGFDCASQREMEEVITAGAKCADLLYAQPCKSISSISFCKQHSVNRTVVDCVEEAEKLGQHGWQGEILIRLAVPDAGSKQPFSSKFGAKITELYPILKCMQTYSLPFSGFSFHVGSECMNPHQFYSALEMCATAKKVADLFGCSTRVLDVGGGFLPDVASFETVAKAIRTGRQDFFPNPELEWIAEPGRFFAHPTVTLQIPILGAKKGRDVNRVYTFDESIYGMFSCIPFDHQKPVFETASSGPLFSSRVFGRTCDSADVLADNIMLPHMEVGDTVSVKNMGAYTFVSSCEFNGFPKPELVLLE